VRVRVRVGAGGRCGQTPHATVKIEVWVFRWQRKVNIRITFNCMQTMTIGERGNENKHRRIRHGMKIGIGEGLE
jgi:hypothetical protein